MEEREREREREREGKVGRNRIFGEEEDGWLGPTKFGDNKEEKWRRRRGNFRHIA